MLNSRKRRKSSTLSGWAPIPLKPLLTRTVSDALRPEPAGGVAQRRQHLLPPVQTLLKANQPLGALVIV